ncbi:MAG: 4-hydroxy-3-methylbut-2-enyl diphosphate reductase [Candidatus Moranbacteria bacterium CG_4_8_14_3_um_filter_43_15]|nr:MAG: 4-hydroxy-3-methylbut-2-enyl diphosphate reductase [Candidatus Moranbacteria bacterium CG17_big_fil_post_rev_8_21_14_2_50_44_12]PIW93078.1 MAG: 4-hydroxy-3-methylbut-2-enyl diphosphate reductase [Candidatus Moranbacteria bacterium CG_4_8_14_3_um_filter_43_15]PJA85365.1 MAG: 4-hydroxy-3-methylbut-2-enyl diphosphate reductase [Candidatus Moranbacteria bacterium CG_4_9_14_3_um_filter_44_28]
MDHKNILKITIAKHSGFCFGVKRAYDLACAGSRSRGKVYILGKLVHNDDVCRDLRKKRIKEIKSLNEAKEGTIIFTAHGVGPRLYEKVIKKGLKIIDTTCPKVVKAQRLAKNYAKKGYQVIVFGDEKHEEVKGIWEWSGDKVKIIGSLKEAKKLKLEKKKKYCLISQTTQNVEEFKRIKDYLSKASANFVYFNTICDSTDSRQNETRKLAEKNDAVIVVGGRDSANSRRLYEIAKSINLKTYFIENARQLKKNWFSDIKKLAITAGASTPEWAISKVIDKIGKID